MSQKNKYTILGIKRIFIPVKECILNKKTELKRHVLKNVLAKIFHNITINSFPRLDAKNSREIPGNKLYAYMPNSIPTINMISMLQRRNEIIYSNNVKFYCPKKDISLLSIL